MSDSKPEELPPVNGMVSSAEEDSKPTEPILLENSIKETEEESPEEPTENPPTLPQEIEGAKGALTADVWHNGNKVTALWSKNQNRNSWIGVSDLGWKKLANNSDTAVVALTILASHAKLLGTTVNLKESSGQIVEMYVW